MRILILLLIFITFETAVSSQIPAFPGALGGGKYTTGARGGKVYIVTNLNDSGVGSLRDAVNQENTTVVFSVSGIIKLKSRLSLRKDNITIAGQTAPGGGICIADYAVNVAANNIIIRYIRFRPGDAQKSEDDALNCFSGAYKNIIIDHCSMSWSIDETTSFYDVKNVTLQWNIISESLFNSFHSKGQHGYGGIFGGQNSSYLFNLFAHHTSRTPRFNGARYKSQTYADSVEFCNNVIYNWGNINSVYGGEGGRYNMINNYYKPGPATPGNLTTSSSSNKRHRILNYTSLYKDGNDTIWGGDFYINGNITAGYADVSVDNWTRGVQKDSYVDGERLKNESRKNMPYIISDFVPLSAQAAYDTVIKNVGAYLPLRDTLDKRVISEVIKGSATFEGNTYKSINSTGISHPSGIIDKPEDVGGYPTYTSLAPLLDTDKDGMPDVWEVNNGLNPNNPEDRNNKDFDGYTMLEVYINGLSKSILSSTSQTKKEKFDIQIFPMPGSHIVEIVNNTGQPILDSALFDINGSLLNPLSTIGEFSTYKIDVSNLQNGMYILRCKSNFGSFSKPIIVLRQ